MTDKHTPGPWYSGGYGTVYKDIGGNRHTVATCHAWAGETEANARLIAAAPDLLAALREIRMMRPVGFPASADDIEIERITANAIRLATGE